MADENLNETWFKWLDRLHDELDTLAACIRETQETANKNKTNITWLIRIVIAVFTVLLGLSAYVIKKVI